MLCSEFWNQLDEMVRGLGWLVCPDPKGDGTTGFAFHHISMETMAIDTSLAPRAAAEWFKGYINRIKKKLTENGLKFSELNSFLTVEIEG